jgi:hypothetical protein
MNGFLRGFTGVLGSLAVVGAGAGMAYGVATIVDDSSAENDAQLQETTAATPMETSIADIPAPSPTTSVVGSREIGGVLRTDNRTTFALCVDTSSLVDAAGIQIAAVTSAEAAAASVMGHPNWPQLASQHTSSGPAPQGLAVTPAQVDAGCPTEPAAFDPVAGPVGTEYVGDNSGRRVQQASPYLFHVYVLPEEEIFRIVGHPDGAPVSSTHAGTEEKLCYEDVCYPVTIGLYFSPTEIADTLLVASEIEHVVGLR